MRRVVDLEVRLAYHERIADSLPEAMKEEGAGVISVEAPDPVWSYAKDGMSHI
jgi:nuclear cap-binding protein subunit 1